MRVYDIIRKKRDGFVLSKEEIDFFINGVNCGAVPDYQVAAFCMAVFFRGLNDDETLYLTYALRDSGGKISLDGIPGFRVDKHSTGGVGDKTTLVVAPIVAACGVTVAKISGRGLGHTGGTVDKLESIPGFKTSLTTSEFTEIAKKHGLVVVGQTSELAPADKKLYAIRDVTATIDSIPLIAASIMGKKLASSDDGIVLDVKVGTGAFMKTFNDAKELARLMVNIGKGAGKKTVAFVTDMNAPLGTAIGNACEVAEAVETLNGNGDKDFSHLCFSLATKMLTLAYDKPERECYEMVEQAVKTGKAFRKFVETVEAQGGNTECLFNTALLPKAEFNKVILSDNNGYFGYSSAEKIGTASVILGAGRNKKDDAIDHGAGIILSKKPGEKVLKGEKIAEMFCSDKNKFSEAERVFKEGLSFSDKPETRKIILDIIE